MNSQNPITETQNENLSGSLKNPTTPQSWQPKPKSPLKRLFILVLLLAGVLGILYAYRLPPFTPNYVATNNAYVRGKATQVSPKVAGYVRQIMVQDYEWVEKGQPLVQIETDQYEMRLAQAQANVKAQEVSLKKNQTSQCVRLRQCECDGREHRIRQSQFGKRQNRPCAYGGIG